ncbi:MAG: bifunctional 5,10-methylenetetrahydrofolate dehydrogenase/5,10-methenyltetrahydrofolate cyclohydrolase [Pseudonocardiales bacterium]|nr:bifunctional 5,10-methylenetetrahydrofolate dehydrogenase/5,10-methenyltetrahydrofolate cyclohydrolase [Pseudonocardiales bacterium]MBV9031289.1 bifunctional 5,10-methylenetetrahydrofolate dehydrogenase/5,10-methenyltetrahydrofolate cyclohydrolase [Pseudonocardiales bacterium]MBW0008783.1 bifunctional 5,10-methylenetetrahydrofolate dehydrogenase/5,10-methenyltetrahydrofolate cyclohydrolase [Pseudonocardiales bacterium]
MSARVLSGKELSATIRGQVTERAAALRAAGTTPRLAVATATDDASSAWYVSSLSRAADRVGITCDVVDLGADADADTIRTALGKLSGQETVHGIILQTPLPPGTALEDLAAEIDPAKDVDGANPLSIGRLVCGLPAYAPATAEAVVAILDHHGIDLEGRHVAVVGRSTVVGKPTAHLLLNRNATVTICHSRTRHLAAVTSRADVLVVAVGKPKMITSEYVLPGAVAIDVGTNPTEDSGLVGDIDAGAVAVRAGALTPVPGGVGPVTTALLLAHTVRAAAR